MISVIIPVHNELLRLPRTMEDLTSSLSGMDYEIILSEDGSSDDSKKLIQQYAQNNSRVRCLMFPEKLGKGLALKRGVGIARGDVIVFFDADSSVSADQVPKALKELDEFDVVIGSRGLKNSVILKKQPFYRQLAGKSYNWLFRLLFHISIRDTQCGFKAFRREVVKDLMNHLQIEGWGFDANLIVNAYQKGYSVKETPIVWNHSEASKLSVRQQAIPMFVSLLQIWFSIHKRNPEFAALKGWTDFLKQKIRLKIRPINMLKLQEQRAKSENHYSDLYNSRNPFIRYIHQKRKRYPLSLIKNNGQILDVGCGDGIILGELKMPRRIVGVDISLTRLKRAKFNAPNANLVLCDAESLPFRDESFGTILCLDVLEHLFHPEETGKEIVRVLRDSGEAIVQFPNERNWSIARLLMLRFPIHVVDHFNDISPRTLTKILGLYLTKSLGIPFNLPFALCLGYTIRYIKTRLSCHMHASNHFKPGNFRQNDCMHAMSEATR